MTPRVVLVVEDGTEYIEAFRRLAAEDSDVTLIRASDAAGARDLLSRHTVDGIFFDVVFDRTPPERLTGDLAALVERFAGDRKHALDHLARHQGFYLVGELAPMIPPGTAVLLAHDFSSEPARLVALQTSVPGLEGVAEGVTITQILKRLLKREGPAKRS